MNHVLVVEHNRIRANLMASSCRKAGMDARISPDPLHAVMAASADRPSMIVVDPADDWADSMSVAEMIHRTPQLADIPVMVMNRTRPNRLMPLEMARAARTSQPN